MITARSARVTKHTWPEVSLATKLSNSSGQALSSGGSLLVGHRAFDPAHPSTEAVFPLAALWLRCLEVAACLTVVLLAPLLGQAAGLGLVLLGHAHALLVSLSLFLGGGVRFAHDLLSL